jgi:hypothetical protein
VTATSKLVERLSEKIIFKLLQKPAIVLKIRLDKQKLNKKYSATNKPTALFYTGNMHHSSMSTDLIF